ncbi:hypothetical protein WDU94_001518 [Cyamophila willieti]
MNVHTRTQVAAVIAVMFLLNFYYFKSWRKSPRSPEVQSSGSNNRFKLIKLTPSVSSPSHTQDTWCDIPSQWSLIYYVTDITTGVTTVFVQKPMLQEAASQQDVHVAPQRDIEISFVRLNPQGAVNSEIRLQSDSITNFSCQFSPTTELSDEKEKETVSIQEDMEKLIMKTINENNNSLLLDSYNKWNHKSEYLIISSNCIQNFIEIFNKNKIKIVEHNMKCQDKDALVFLPLLKHLSLPDMNKTLKTIVVGNLSYFYLNKLKMTEVLNVDAETNVDYIQSKNIRGYTEKDLSLEDVKKYAKYSQESDLFHLIFNENTIMENHNETGTHDNVNTLDDPDVRESIKESIPELSKNDSSEKINNSVCEHYKDKVEEYANITSKHIEEINQNMTDSLKNETNSKGKDSSNKTLSGNTIDQNQPEKNSRKINKKDDKRRQNNVKNNGLNSILVFKNLKDINELYEKVFTDSHFKSPSLSPYERKNRPTPQISDRASITANAMVNLIENDDIYFNNKLMKNVSTANNLITTVEKSDTLNPVSMKFSSNAEHIKNTLKSFTITESSNEDYTKESFIPNENDTPRLENPDLQESFKPPKENIRNLLMETKINDENSSMDTSTMDVHPSATEIYLSVQNKSTTHRIRTKKKSYPRILKEINTNGNSEPNDVQIIKLNGEVFDITESPFIHSTEKPKNKTNSARLRSFPKYTKSNSPKLNEETVKIGNDSNNNSKTLEQLIRSKNTIRNKNNFTHSTESSKEKETLLKGENHIVLENPFTADSNKTSFLNSSNNPEIKPDDNFDENTKHFEEYFNPMKTESTSKSYEHNEVSTKSKDVNQLEVEHRTHELGGKPIFKTFQTQMIKGQLFNDDQNNMKSSKSNHVNGRGYVRYNMELTTLAYPKHQFINQPNHDTFKELKDSPQFPKITDNVETYIPENNTHKHSDNGNVDKPLEIKPYKPIILNYSSFNYNSSKTESPSVRDTTYYNDYPEATPNYLEHPEDTTPSYNLNTNHDYSEYNENTEAPREENNYVPPEINPVTPGSNPQRNSVLGYHKTVKPATYVMSQNFRSKFNELVRNRIPPYNGNTKTPRNEYYSPSVPIRPGFTESTPPNPVNSGYYDSSEVQDFSLSEGSPKLQEINNPSRPVTPKNESPPPPEVTYDVENEDYNTYENGVGKSKGVEETNGHASLYSDYTSTENYTTEAIQYHNEHYSGEICDTENQYPNYDINGNSAYTEPPFSTTPESFFQSPKQHHTVPNENSNSHQSDDLYHKTVQPASYGMSQNFHAKFNQFLKNKVPPDKSTIESFSLMPQKMPVVNSSSVKSKDHLHGHTTATPKLPKINDLPQHSFSSEEAINQFLNSPFDFDGFLQNPKISSTPNTNTKRPEGSKQNVDLNYKQKGVENTYEKFLTHLKNNSIINQDAIRNIVSNIEHTLPKTNQANVHHIPKVSNFIQSVGFGDINSFQPLTSEKFPYGNFESEEQPFKSHLPEITSSLPPLKVPNNMGQILQNVSHQIKFSNTGQNFDSKFNNMYYVPMSPQYVPVSSKPVIPPSDRIQFWKNYQPKLQYHLPPGISNYSE